MSYLQSLRGLWAKATQFGFDFSGKKPKQPVKQPGSRGGKFYRTKEGEVRYGDRPTEQPKKPEQKKLAPTGGQVKLGLTRTPEGQEPRKYTPKPGAATFSLDGESPAPKPPDRESYWSTLPEHAETGRDFAQDDEGVAEWRRAVSKEPWRFMEATYFREMEEYAMLMQSLWRERHTVQAQRQARQWGKVAAAMHAHDWGEDMTPEQRETVDRYRKQYIKGVKKGLSQGKPVPREVVAQRPEYRKAVGARERYLKGRHTSFANESVAVRRDLQHELGAKVKRQDGKPLEAAQLAQLREGTKALQDVLGPGVLDLMRRGGLTIAHTNGKHPFLSKFGGLFHSADNSISVGVAGVPALAHEFGHWLDFQSGAAVNARHSYRHAKRTVTCNAMSGDSDHGDLRLIAEASASMNSGANRLMKMKLKDQGDDQERERLRAQKYALGAYWYQSIEVWARLVEQYVGTKLGRETFAAMAPEELHGMPGWWSAEEFARLEPMVERQLARQFHALGVTSGLDSAVGLGQEYDLAGEDTKDPIHVAHRLNRDLPENAGGFNKVPAKGEQP